MRHGAGLPEPSPGFAKRRWGNGGARLGGGSPGPETWLKLAESLGLSVPRTVACGSERQVVSALAETGFPAVLKTANQAVAHKTDAGGVVTGLGHEACVLAAYRSMARSLGPEVLVQATAPPGVEMIVGMITDPVFGPIMTVGAGGVPGRGARRCGDVRSARRHRGGRRADRRPQVFGAAGRCPRPPSPSTAGRSPKPCPRLSVLAAALAGQLEEFDVNPLLVHESGTLALDLLVKPKA